MKNPHQIGDQKVFETTVSEGMLATFDSGMVHPVYSTFALGKDVEWACRLFVLEMKGPEEEGVGSYLSITHLAPAPLGSEVRIIATLEEVSGNEVSCSFEAYANGIRIAYGEQKQRIIAKVKFERLVSSLNPISDTSSTEE